MSFPALAAFAKDRRPKMRHLRVYTHLQESLDFCEIRAIKREDIADATGVHRAHVTRVLNALVTWGYLLEHAREADQYGRRRFTLTWSRRGAKTAPPEATAEAVGAA